MTRPRRVLYFQFTNAAFYPPLVQSTYILADHGVEVLVLGQEADANKAKQIEPHSQIRVHNLAHGRPGPKQKLHYLHFAARVLRHALSFRPDWCYASDLWSCPIGFSLAQLGFRVIYHEHDRMSPDRASAFVRACLAARSRLADAAALCILPSEQRARAFRQEHPRARTATVLNCAARRDIGPVRAPRTGPLHLYYHGTIVPDRIPLTVLEALAQCPGVRLTIAGYPVMGAPRYVQELTDAAHRLGVASRVTQLPIAYQRSALWPPMTDADVGLTLIPTRSADSNFEQMVGASNKPFDYLARGLALMFTQRSDWIDQFGAYGRACVPEDSNSIVAAIRAFESDPALARELGGAGQERCRQDWNYEHQFEPVLRLMMPTP